VICGRKKDIIIVNGRNVFPEDVEAAAANVPGVRRGNVVAFRMQDDGPVERVVVFAESSSDDRAQTTKQVRGEILRRVGVPVHDIVLLEPRTMVKTSSGKLQRSFYRDLYQATAT
jgi:fatty-acyl-CoA synthase